MRIWQINWLKLYTTVFCQSSVKSQDSMIAVVKHDDQIVFFHCAERSPRLWNSAFKTMGTVRKASTPEGFQKGGGGGFCSVRRQPFKHKTPSSAANVWRTSSPLSLHVESKINKVFILYFFPGIKYQVL